MLVPTQVLCNSLIRINQITIEALQNARTCAREKIVCDVLCKFRKSSHSSLSYKERGASIGKQDHQSKRCRSCVLEKRSHLEKIRADIKARNFHERLSDMAANPRSMEDHSQHGTLKSKLSGGGFKGSFERQESRDKEFQHAVKTILHANLR